MGDEVQEMGSRGGGGMRRVHKERERRMKDPFYLLKRSGWQTRIIEIRGFGKGV